MTIFFNCGSNMMQSISSYNNYSIIYGTVNNKKSFIQQKSDLLFLQIFNKGVVKINESLFSKKHYIYLPTSYYI